MNVKSILAVALTVVVLAGLTGTGRADEAELKGKIVAIDKELAPYGRQVHEDADVKAAAEELKAAQAKMTHSLEAALIKAYPQAKELLEQRAKLQQELVTLRKAEREAIKPPATAPAPTDRK